MFQDDMERRRFTIVKLSRGEEDSGRLLFLFTLSAARLCIVIGGLR